MRAARGLGIVLYAAERGRVPESIRVDHATQRHDEARNLTDMTSAYFSVPTLCAIALVHVYWAFGGSLGKRAAIPEQDGVPLLRPSAPGTLAIAAALLAGAGAVASRAGWLWPNLYPGAIAFAVVALALIFAVRAIGDFRYVGFFKRIRGSRFARMDSLCYSPLCAALALSIASMLWPW
jgi:cation transport ATPase